MFEKLVKMDTNRKGTPNPDNTVSQPLIVQSSFALTTLPSGYIQLVDAMSYPFSTKITFPLVATAEGFLNNQLILSVSWIRSPYTVTIQETHLL
ncbi:hypothetical protein [Bacillus testis]|uniref:hypothetical protein n=1 Tax=Bacillus testis TaxID=1622072 RepID=UPI0012B6049A|nr:hypothetical protein [Bacillus testis]